MGTVDDYLQTLEPGDRAVLARVFAVVRDEVPDATQGTSYGMPALLYRAKGLIAVMRTKKHIGVYPFSGHVPGVVAPTLAAADRAALEIEKGTIRFQPEHPPSDEAIRAIVAARVAEIEDPSLRRR